MGENGASDTELERAMKEAEAAVDARSQAKTTEVQAGGKPSGSVEVQVETETATKPVDAYSAARKELEEALASAKKDASDLKDRWMRAAADLENYKKRAARERDEVVKFGNERVLKDLLPVLDDLDRTVQAAAGAEGGTALATFLDGAKLTQKKFLTQLEKNGVEGFDCVGKPFDPNMHEAVQQIASATVPAGAVAMEIRRGFFLNGRLLRPALVAVSLGPAS